ncbi:hypothetical protein [Sinorhizobium terangae]|uniref:hypothetical protein n=1 Tax=Sinorhizobium terangae TaxID=110322 RepID=UPI0024B17D4E|nr:hypothetical protein [Sinorhizobium terangae]WFU51751.1 hypothetical protein QA637_30265 [Sinorhizobium terangae]
MRQKGERLKIRRDLLGHVEKVAGDANRSPQAGIPGSWIIDFEINGIRSTAGLEVLEDDGALSVRFLEAGTSILGQVRHADRLFLQISFRATHDILPASGILEGFFLGDVACGHIYEATGEDIHQARYMWRARRTSEVLH